MKVGRDLGVDRNFQDGNTPDLKHCTMDMDNYAQQALDMYHAVPNAPKLRDGICYLWLEPSPDDIANLMESKESTIFGHCAVSLLMKSYFMQPEWYAWISAMLSIIFPVTCPAVIACAINSWHTYSDTLRLPSNQNYTPHAIEMKLEPLSCMPIRTQT